MMIYKHTTISITILALSLLVGVFAITPTIANAQSLTVSFEENPLFDEANFLPGNEVTRTVDVTNGTGKSQDVIVEAINSLDSDGLGDVLDLVIKEGAETLYSGTLAEFLRTGEVLLSPLGAGNSTTYSFGITFDSGSNNDTQGKTLGFDVCVGFEGGATHCGDTIIGSEGDTGGGEGSGGSGGSSRPGSGGGPITLAIFSESVSQVSVDTATIVWNTNLLSTSQVIYGLASGGPYILTLTPPNFGYPFYTTEDSTKVIQHSMLLTGLTPGETYLYRVISQASPPTISFEHQFTVPLLAQADTINFTGGNTSPANTSGSVLGSSTVPLILDEPGDVSSPVNDTSSNLTAAVLLSGFGDIFPICTSISLLVLLLIYLIWRLWLRRKYEKAGIPEEEIQNRFYLFFGGAILLTIVIAVLINEYCILPSLLIALLIDVIIYLFRRIRR